jgi:predicted transcriptional regulator
MFSAFLKNIDNVLEDAKKSPHVVQDNFFKIYEIVENYVAKNNLMLSNMEILSRRKKKSFNTYIIYCNDAFKHANDLANALAKETIYILLYTQQQNKEFSITVKGKWLIHVYNIPLQFLNVIYPVKIDNMLLYPPEFELIDIYHKLYSPHYADEWDKVRELEPSIKQLFKKRKNLMAGDMIEGGAPVRRKKINSSIINWLKERNDYVIVGEFAINMMTELSKKTCCIQLIIDSPLDKFVAEFDNFIYQLTGTRTIKKTHTANIYIEPRLKKTVLKTRLNNEKTVRILEIFNSGQFELIPYSTKNNLMIGYPNVLRTYILLNLWYSTILFALGKIDKYILSSNVGNVFRQMDMIDLIKNSEYSHESYLGTYVKLAVWKKHRADKGTFYSGHT